jgi:thiol-disulfide isomerase/thioredoxin
LSPSSTGRPSSRAASSNKGRTTPSSVKGRPASSAKGRAAAPPAKRRLPIALIAGIVLAIGLVVVIVVTMGTGSDDGPLEVGTPTVTGDTLPVFTTTTNDPAIGQPMPEVVGADFDGTPVSITRDGRAKMILLVAHWCSVCRQEVPIIVDWLLDADIPDNVDLYTVSTGVDRNQANYPPSEWFEEEGWTLPVVMDDDARTVASAFGLPAYPYFVFVNSEGNVVTRLTGGMTAEDLGTLVTGLAEA